MEHETILLAAAASLLWGAAAITLFRGRRPGSAQVLAAAAAGTTAAALNSVQLRRQGDRVRDITLSAVDLYRESGPVCRHPAGASSPRLRPVAPA
jgi:hypothetical protein